MMMNAEVMPVPPSQLGQHYRSVKQRLRTPPFPVLAEPKAVPIVPDAVALAQKSMDKYVSAAAEAYGLEPDGVIAGVPTKEIVLARRLAVALSRRWGGFSIPVISDYFGLEEALIAEASNDLSTILYKMAISTKTSLSTILPHIMHSWETISDKSEIPSITEIKTAVAKHYHIPLSEFRSATRTHPVVIYRQLAMALCRRLTDKSSPAIGVQFGNRDHTTVLHAYWKFECLIEGLNSRMSPNASALDWVQALSKEMETKPLGSGRERRK